MNIEAIQQAVTRLSPEELARFRAWFREFENQVILSEATSVDAPTREQINKLRGSLKGKGGLKALMEERRKESLL
jgi:hypothetical protein